MTYHLSHNRPSLKRLVWDYIDEHHPELWNQPAPLKASDALVEKIVQSVAVTAEAAEGRVRTRNARSSRLANLRHQLRQQIGSWLADPATHTPHLDEIALERALRFEWDVVEALSEAERDEWMRRLSAQIDPWDDALEARDNDGVLTQASQRRMAWLEAPQEVRGRVSGAVLRRRSRERKVSA